MFEIYSCAVYHPYWIYSDGGKERNPDADEYTYALMDFKKPENARPGKHEKAINTFSDLFINELQNNGLVGDQYQIVIVPSSRAGVVSAALISVANNAADELGLEVCANALERVTQIDALHEGGDRSQAVHLRSIRVNELELDEDKEIILLDDVTTSGNTLYACETLLRAAGFENIHLVALLRTER
ncbi:phosphoribosyltransferase [Aeromonas salmonicida]|uniref:ComF family protein n=1 Tax=Aeromonas TaxID=642 RepID=UPI002B47EA6E|nr:phosphoribosyltransferase [Aeromonas veronii]